MRIICDVCEGAPASIFCAADEAALCRECDEKVHMCNKLASRHVRVGLADPSNVSRCDICENAPAFFYCEIDGSSLCLQCDMIVHVGGKRTHGRYLLLRQRVTFPGDNVVNPKNVATLAKEPAEDTQEHKAIARNHKVSNTAFDTNNDGHGKMDSCLIDLNIRPARTHGQASNNQQMDLISDSNHDSVGVNCRGSLHGDAEK